MNSSNNLTIEEKIDEILETYATYVYSEAPDFYVPAGIKYDGINKNEAKQQLLTLIQEEKTKARIDEIKQIMPLELGKEFCRVCGFNSEVFRKHLTDRLQALKQESKK